MPASSNRFRTDLKWSIGVDSRHLRISSRGRRAGSRSGENNSISPMPHSWHDLIITSTASGAPGVLGICRKLYVMAPRRTPPTTESIFAAKAGNGMAAALIFRKSLLEYMGSLSMPLCFTLHVTNVHRLVQRFNRIMPFRRSVFMGEVSGKTQVHYGLSDVTIIQFLRTVDIVPPGIAAGMKMSDPLEVVAYVPDDIAIHDLRMIDVKKNFHSRRIHSRHHVDAPRNVIEHVVLVIHLAVQIFHADGDAFVFGLPFDPIQERHAIVGAFPIIHPPPVT